MPPPDRRKGVLLNTIEIHTAAGVAQVTLNRPDKLNAINDEMRAELTAAFAGFDADPAVRVVILTGAGKAFCAGGDLQAIMIPPEANRPRIVEPLDRFAKPIVAAINGLAYGGGLEVALACDVRIAATTARFALPEVRIGSMPGSGGTQRLTPVIGPTLAARMILTGEPIDAARALAAGLVSELCEPDKLIEAAQRHRRDHRAQCAARRHRGQARAAPRGRDAQRRAPRFRAHAVQRACAHRRPQ